MTLAHELGHLVMHPGAAKLRMESGNRTPPKIRPYESAEWQARKFAAFFLLPTHVVRQFGSAREVADSCQVSLQAAEIRCNEVGHIKRHASPCVEELISDIDALQTKGPTLRKV
jgi:Zn-dependent peptidase ImmA (M78 family)